jgi:predicted  nucleic acid-binding Zn-ribbon protein
MAEQESVETRLARIEEQLKSIHDTLKKQVALRHVNKDGICDAYVTVVEHDRRLSQWAPDVEKIEDHEKRINQWTGALLVVACICSMIGTIIGALLAKAFK